MTNETTTSKSIKKTETDKTIKNLEKYAELKKSDLPGVVETASLGEIKKPEPSKKK